jgi:hypothetical protein
MTGKRWWGSLVLVGLLAMTGCRSFCDRWCPPPQQPVYVSAPPAPAGAYLPAQPATCCVPCCIPCCPPANYQANWSQPSGNCCK